MSVQIPHDKVAEFLEVMKADAIGSRKEEGCIRFDLLEGATGEDGVTFYFYEVYKDAEAAAFHKTTDHYKKWATFKAANMDTVGKSQTVVGLKLHDFS